MFSLHLPTGCFGVTLVHTDGAPKQNLDQFNLLSMFQSSTHTSPCCRSCCLHLCPSVGLLWSLWSPSYAHVSSTFEGPGSPAWDGAFSPYPSDLKKFSPCCCSPASRVQWEQITSATRMKFLKSELRLVTEVSSYFSCASGLDHIYFGSSRPDRQAILHWRKPNTRLLSIR